MREREWFLRFGMGDGPSARSVAKRRRGEPELVNAVRGGSTRDKPTLATQATTVKLVVAPNAYRHQARILRPQSVRWGRSR